MHAGAEGGSEQVVSMLMRAGAGKDINGQAPRSGLTPLHLAVMGGKLAAAKVLIMLAGADVNKIDAEGVAPLHLALRHGHAELAQVLLLGGADADKQPRNGDYPIHLASCRGEDGVLRSLLHKGANVNRRDSAEVNPLCLALKADHISTVNILLAGGASASLGPSANAGHNTVAPNHLAVRENNPDVIVALARAGADIEKTYHGEPPLCMSTFSTCYSPAMPALLNTGANLHAKCRYTERTALHMACFVVNPDAADLLLRWGTDETAVDRNGATPAAVIRKTDEAPEEEYPTTLRRVKLLEFADQDRAWRRRGFLFMCRAHPDRLRLVAHVSTNNTSESVGETREGRNCRTKR